MPRNYIRKTDKGKVPKEVMERAVTAVRGGGKIREVARNFGIPRTTLNNNLKKAERGVPLEPNYQHSRVFSPEQEDSLAIYLETCSRMFHGMTTTSTKRLAYEMAVKNGIKTPLSWQESQAAGKEWLIGFMKRHPRLSLRQPSLGDFLRRKETGRGRKKGRSIVATSTTELNRKKHEAFQKERKRPKDGQNSKQPPRKKLSFVGESSDSGSEADTVILEDSDDDLISTDSDRDMEDTVDLNGVESVSVGDYVLCEYAGKRSVVYYVGIVRKEMDEDEDVEVEFLGKSDKVHGKFVKPAIEDVASVQLSQIKTKLTKSLATGTTSRTKDGIIFKETFGDLCIR